MVVQLKQYITRIQWLTLNDTYTSIDIYQHGSTHIKTKYSTHLAN